jgi:hypothetical protein
MPLKYDKDFDTNPIIIDNTWSKKRKQKEIENFSKYAVRRAQLEEVIGEIVQTPPAGTKETKKTKFGEVSSIVPHVKIGHAVGEGYCLQPSIWHAVHYPATGVTAVPLKKYVNYLKDPEYITFAHERVIGMMQQWVECVQETVKDLREDWDYSWSAVKDQYNWATNWTDAIMTGLSKFKLFPVTVLNSRAVIQLIDGVQDEEKADFVLQMANCYFCEIAVIRHIESNNVSIVTIYDNNNKHKVAYSKGEIKDLNHLHQADRAVSEEDFEEMKKEVKKSKKSTSSFSLDK